MFKAEITYYNDFHDKTYSAKCFSSGEIEISRWEEFSLQGEEDYRINFNIKDKTDDRFKSIKLKITAPVMEKLIDVFQAMLDNRTGVGISDTRERNYCKLDARKETIRLDKKNNRTIAKRLMTN